LSYLIGAVLTVLLFSGLPDWAVAVCTVLAAVVFVVVIFFAEKNAHSIRLKRGKRPWE